MTFGRIYPVEMRPRHRIVLLALLVLTGLVLTASASTKTVAVSLTKNGFNPAAVSVAAGDVVTWKNDDTVSRTIVSTDAPFPVQTLPPGQTFSFTFTKTGKCRFEDPNAKKRTQMFVTVAAAPLSVTVAAPKPLVVYGNKTTLTGTVSTGQPNEQVTILAKPCGATAAAKVTTVATTTGGAYTILVQPLRNTLYTAQVRTATTATGADALVKPRLTLTKPAKGRFAVAVRGSISFSGRAVVLQRWNATLAKWVNVKSALLVKGPAATAPTIVSKATFRAALKARTKVRVSISQFQVGGCHRPGLSNVVLA
jgi:plastocyanin